MNRRYQPTPAEVEQQQFYQMGNAFGLNQNIADPTVMAGLGQQAMTGFPNAAIPQEDRQRLFNQIVYANRDARIAQEQQSGAPRTVFTDNVDRYNYLSGLSQQANAQKNFQTLQDPYADPKQRFVAQTVNPLTREIVRDVAPENFNTYAQHLRFNVATSPSHPVGYNPAAMLNAMGRQALDVGMQHQYQPVNSMDQLNRSKTFASLPRERQEQVAQSMGIEYINRYEQEKQNRKDDATSLQSGFRSGKLDYNWETDSKGNRFPQLYSRDTVKDEMGREQVVLNPAPFAQRVAFAKSIHNGEFPIAPDWAPQQGGSVAPVASPSSVSPANISQPTSPIQNEFTKMFPRPEGIVPQVLASTAQGARDYYGRMRNSIFGDPNSDKINERLVQTAQRGPWDSGVSGARQLNAPFMHAIEGLGFIREGGAREYENRTYGRTISPHDDPEYVWYMKEKATHPDNPNRITPEEFDRRAIELGWAKPRMPDKIRKSASNPKGYSEGSPTVVNPTRTSVDYLYPENQNAVQGRPKGYL